MSLTHTQRMVLTGLGVGIVIGLVVGAIGALLGLPAGVRGGLTGVLVVIALGYVSRRMRTTGGSERI